MLRGLEKCSRLIIICSFEIFHEGSQTPWEAVWPCGRQENEG